MTSITSPAALAAAAAAPIASRPDPAEAPPARSITRAPAAPVLANPSMRLDGGLNIVVLEFYDSSGELRAKLPSERELRAYQLGQDPAMPGAPKQLTEAV